jgi:hypothetical protein
VYTPRIVYTIDRLIGHWIDFSTNNSAKWLCTKNQSGFREHHSTETALLDLTNDWLHNMDNGLLYGVLFLDFKKAFYSVNHNILLSKLELYGIRGTSLKWFRSYFSNRKQICSINGKQSDVNELKCGVPQGSNLGPFLFLLYINDLPRCSPNY